MLKKSDVIAYYRYDKVYPFRLPESEENLALAGKLVDLFSSGINKHRFELEQEVHKLAGNKKNARSIQGLARVLFQRCEFSAWQSEDPEELRDRVYTRAARYWIDQEGAGADFEEHKKAILASLGEDQQEKLHHTDSWLYGDVPNNQVLGSFKEITPLGLIRRYNLEQLRGVLSNAESMTIRLEPEVEGNFRQVLRVLKFFGLMFQIERQDQSEIRILVDGPSSILENGKSYGFELANFFPSFLLLKKGWKIEARVKKPGGRKKYLLEVSDQSGYETYIKPRSVWHQQKIAELVDRINEKYPELKALMITKMIPLSQNRYLLPDFEVRKEGKKELLVEWMPFISEQRSKKLVDLLAEIPDNYLFAVKGKRKNLGVLEKKMGGRMLLFSKDLTAPALKKSFDKLV